MAGRAARIVLVGTVGLALAVGVAGAVAWAELPAIAARLASRAAGRPVTVGALRVQPGRWIGVDLRNAALANLPGGTREQMASVDTVTGEVALWPLLHGTLVARNVRVVGADLLLEHVNGQPNWRNGPRRPEQPGGGRDTFPTLLGTTGLQGIVTFRTRSGHPLVTRLDGVELQAATPSDPATLRGPGSYQGVPVTLDVRLGSFNQLHAAADPFPTDITLTSGDTMVHFTGTMTNPLGVNGANGKLDLTAPTPVSLEKMFGAAPAPAPPIEVAGDLRHDDPRWELEGIKGKLGSAPLENGTLRYTEGEADQGKPDEVSLDLRFGTVDLDRLLAAFDDGNRSEDGNKGGGFVPAAEPNPRGTVKLAAAAVSYGATRLVRPALSLTLAPKLATLDEITAEVWGGRLRAEARLRAGERDGATLEATAVADGMDVAALSRGLGAAQNKLAGRMNLHAELTSAGTGSEALRAARGAAVATMAGGSVSAQWVELAATDIAGLLRSPRSMVGVRCLLAVAEMRDGLASVGPLRLRSADGTIVGRGQVNLQRQTLDVVVASEARTTGALALDVPVRVSGALSDPSVSPAGEAAGQRALAEGLGRGLPASLHEAAERSACAR